MHACVLCGAVSKRGKKKLELQMFVGAEIEPGWNHCSLTPSHLFSPLSASLVVPITGVMSLYVPKTMPAIFEKHSRQENQLPVGPGSFTIYKQFVLFLLFLSFGVGCRYRF